MIKEVAAPPVVENEKDKNSSTEIETYVYGKKMPDGTESAPALTIKSKY